MYVIRLWWLNIIGLGIGWCYSFNYRDHYMCMLPFCLVFLSLSLYKFMLHKSKNNYMIAYIILGKTRNCIKINALCLVYSNTTCKLSSFSDAYETIDCIPFSPKTRENSCHQISKVLVQLVYLLHQSRIDNWNHIKTFAISFFPNYKYYKIVALNASSNFLGFLINYFW